MESYSRAAMERVMKVQDVILRAMAKKIAWWQAAEILGTATGTYGVGGSATWKRGTTGCSIGSGVSRRDGGCRWRRWRRCLRCGRRYFDLNVEHFHEKLGAEHGIELSYNWVKQVLQGSESGGAGVQAWSGSETARASAPTGDAVAHRREPAPVVSGRALVRPDRDSGRRDHRDLIRPTVEEESTATVMAGLREVMERHGAFCAPYSDRGSHFWLTPKVGGQVYRHRLTPGGRELHELGVQMIPTYSPQARGRSERNFGTWQGRLPQEPRLHKIARSGSCQCLSARALHRRL
jgi:hypothetical protein